MSQLHLIILFNNFTYFVLCLQNDVLIWNAGKMNNTIWKSGSWKSDKNKKARSLIQGGSDVKDKDLFPWAAFIFTSFPCYTWKIWDPVKKEIRFEHHEKMSQWEWDGCSGVWVTAKLVLTNDHCLQLSKPPYHVFADTEEDPKTSDKTDIYYRNIIKDKSKYPVVCQHPIAEKYRGSKHNIAVKLYGLDYLSSQPLDTTALEKGIIHPWWEYRNPDSRAFEVMNYRILHNGVDLAILELDEAYIRKYFDVPKPFLNLIFSRLRWVANPQQKLKVGDRVVQIGSGMLSDMVTNPREKLRRTNDEAMIDPSFCKHHSTWNKDFDVCMSMETRPDRMKLGDSGGPSFTLVSEKETPAKDAIWMIHTVHTGTYSKTPEASKQVYVGDKKKLIVNYKD